MSARPNPFHRRFGQGPRCFLLAPLFRRTPCQCLSGNPLYVGEGFIPSRKPLHSQRVTGGDKPLPYVSMVDSTVSGRRLATPKGGSNGILSARYRECKPDDSMEKTVVFPFHPGKTERKSPCKSGVLPALYCIVGIGTNWCERRFTSFSNTIPGEILLGLRSNREALAAFFYPAGIVTMGAPSLRPVSSTRVKMNMMKEKMRFDGRSRSSIQNQ